MNVWKWVAVVLSTMTVLAGCGAGASGDRSDGQGGDAGGVFPVTVEHFFGSTEVPRAPRRVVALGYTDDQALLALGVRPVGMVDQYANPPGRDPDINTQWPWVKAAWGDVRPEVVMANGDSQPNYEKIAVLRPDLIVAVYSDIDRAAYERLSKIAPTVGRTKAEAEPFSARWQDNALQISRAVGKAEDGGKLVAGIEQKFAAVRAAHPEFAGQTAVAVSWYSDSIAPFTSTDVRGRILANMGFRASPEIDGIAGGKFYVRLSPERVDMINLDRIFVIGDEADHQALRNNPLFASLPAVRAGKASYVLDSEGPAVGAAMSQSTLLSLPYALDQIAKAVR